MKIANYKKFFRGISIVFLFVLIILIFLARVCFSYNIKNFNTIYVSSGDTLWSIASKLQTSNYYKGKDVRYIINDLKSINNLKISNLSVGDKLLIPVI